MFYFYTIIEISQIYILSLHDALPILGGDCMNRLELMSKIYDKQMEIVNILKKYHSTVDIYNYQNLTGYVLNNRSEEHTSELQSRFDLVCRLLLEKKKRATFINMSSNT